jgi:adenylosuccinate lyase
MHYCGMKVITNLWVDKERMISNIESQKGLVMAEKVMLALVEKGVSREESHEVLRAASMESISKKEELIDICSRDPLIATKLTANELSEVFEPHNHLGVSSELVDECVAKARKEIA